MYQKEQRAVVPQQNKDRVIPHPPRLERLGQVEHHCIDSRDHPLDDASVAVAHQVTPTPAVARAISRDRLNS